MIFICHISSACHACLCLNRVFYFGETEYAQPFLFLLKRRWFVPQRIWLEAGNIRTFVSWWFSTFWLDLTQMRSRIYMLVMWDKNLKSENNPFFFGSVNLCDNLFAKQNQQPVILPAPPSGTLLRLGSPPTPLYVKERWILLLFNSLWFCCGVLDFMDNTVWWCFWWSHICRIVGSFAKPSCCFKCNFISLFGCLCRAPQTFLCFLFTPLDTNINVERSCWSNNVVGDCVYIECVYSLYVYTGCMDGYII